MSFPKPIIFFIIIKERLKNFSIKQKYSYSFFFKKNYWVAEPPFGPNRDVTKEGIFHS
jgi:hypothetical protein